VFLVISLAAIANGRRSSPDTGTCSKALGFDADRKPADRSGHLLFCKEHQSRTCCEHFHTEDLTKRVAFFFQGFSLPDFPSLSSKCQSVTETVWCSLCDGAVGTGEKAQGGSPVLCRPLCDRWFDACRHDFFAPPDAKEPGLTPCTESSVICSPLSDIVTSGEDFCRMSGYTVPKGAVEVEGVGREGTQVSPAGSKKDTAAPSGGDVDMFRRLAALDRGGIGSRASEGSDGVACFDGVSDALIKGSAPRDATGGRRRRARGASPESPYLAKLRSVVNYLHSRKTLLLLVLLSVAALIARHMVGNAFKDLENSYGKPGGVGARGVVDSAEERRRRVRDHWSKEDAQALKSAVLTQDVGVLGGVQGEDSSLTAAGPGPSTRITGVASVGVSGDGGENRGEVLGSVSVGAREREQSRGRSKKGSEKVSDSSEGEEEEEEEEEVDSDEEFEAAPAEEEAKGTAGR